MVSYLHLINKGLDGRFARARLRWRSKIAHHLLEAPSDKNDADDVKAKTDYSLRTGKGFYVGHFRHNLGYTHENTQSCQQQGYTPDQLGFASGCFFFWDHFYLHFPYMIVRTNIAEQTPSSQILPIDFSKSYGALNDVCKNMCRGERISGNKGIGLFARELTLSLQEPQGFGAKASRKSRSALRVECVHALRRGA